MQQIDKLRFIERVKEGCLSVARARARSKQQVEDFMGEAMLAALEVIDRYADKSEDELVLIIGRSAINRITQAQRKEEVIHHRFPQEYNDHLDCVDDPVLYDVDLRDFIRVLSSRLSASQRQMLSRRIEVLDTCTGENDETMGEIAMVTKKSKATVSRAFTNIRSAALRLSYDLPQ